MPSQEEQGTFYGNLQSYKYLIRPNGLEVIKNQKSTHSKKVLQLLKFLALHGSSTTWEIAKISFPNDISKLRTREKEYRRYIVGRNDRGKHYAGILELSLVVKDGLNFDRAPSNKYRLSLHGILFCLDTINFNES